LRRALDLLCLLNEEDGTNVGELSRVTGIHRATIYRILETFREAGFVRKGSSPDVYHLTGKLRRLSSGLTRESNLGHVVFPILQELQRDIGWEANFALFEENIMVIRETSNPLSPYAMGRVKIGSKAPVLHSSLGHAFLSFSDRETRESIINVLQTSEVPDQEMARDGDYVRIIVETTRKRGYGVSPGIFAPNKVVDHKKVSAIAVPVSLRGRAVGSLNMVFYLSAMSNSAAADKHLPRLQAAAKDIERSAICVSESDHRTNGVAAMLDGAAVTPW
jgi:IclR family mhp operon transcriptional activator